MKVDFKFEIDQTVQTKLTGTGIIEMTALDDHNNITYYVRYASGIGSWVKESNITTDDCDSETEDKDVE